jgi:hypothetical protein
MDVAENSRRFLSSKWYRLGLTSAVLTFGVMSVHNFLSVNNPVGKGVLVVEAWIPAQALAESARIFNSGRYSYFVVVGGPIQGVGSLSDRPRTYDDLAAKRLEKLGFDTKKLVKITVPYEPAGSRTIASAAAVKAWLGDSGISVCCVEIFTVGVHARRSWVLFQRVLGDRYRVGIIAGSEVSDDQSRFWFFSKRGIWIFVRNLAGYAYSKFIVLSSVIPFRP